MCRHLHLLVCLCVIFHVISIFQDKKHKECFQWYCSSAKDLKKNRYHITMLFLSFSLSSHRLFLGNWKNEMSGSYSLVFCLYAPLIPYFYHYYSHFYCYYYGYHYFYVNIIIVLQFIMNVIFIIIFNTNEIVVVILPLLMSLYWSNNFPNIYHYHYS